MSDLKLKDTIKRSGERVFLREKAETIGVSECVNKEKAEKRFFSGFQEKEAAICTVCFRQCNIPEGGVGSCNARKMEKGKIFSLNYGKITSLSLDPIEKKPLARFYPGSMILSLGSFGCGMRCPFCQNAEISRAGEAEVLTESFTPQEAARAAVNLVEKRNIGLAYTYNEPLVGYEFLLDTGQEIHKAGLKNVLVSNGCCSSAVAEKVIPLMDAMNIDLKVFSEIGYRRLGGDFKQVKSFIEMAAESGNHLELTTLIVPHINDDEEMFREECRWIRSMDPGIPLHVTRFFPRYRMDREMATEPELVQRYRDIADEYLDHVYTGNL